MLDLGAFGFDVGTGLLTRDGTDLPLGRTAARVLAVLVEHHPRGVTQEEIRRTVWPSHVVDRGAVKGYISDLRAVLGDDPPVPRFIASEDEGYPFLATPATRSPGQRDARRAALVGRDHAMAEMRDALDRALCGQRRIVFVTGPGAEASLLRALSIARQQGSRAWELRAATSLAALWNGGGKSRNARELLAGVLGGLTEGAGTADVQKATVLLAKLG